MRRSIRGFLLLSLLIAGPVFAQGERNLAAGLEEARQRLAAHEGDSAADRDGREAAQERIDLLQELERTKKEVAALPDTAGVPKDLEQVDAELAAVRNRPAPEPFELENAAEVEGYRERYANALKVRDESVAALAERRATRDRDDEELKELPRREAQAKRDRDELSGTDELTKYRQESATIREEVLAARRAFLSRAAEVRTAFEPLLQSRKDLQELLLAREEKKLEYASASAKALRENEAQEELDAAARRLEAALTSDDPIVRGTALLEEEKAQAIAGALTAQNALLEAEGAIARRMVAIGGVREERQRLEKRLRFQGTGLAELLKNAQKRRTMEAENLQSVVRPALDKVLETAQKDLIAVLDRIWDLEQPPAKISDVVRLVAEVEPDRRGEAQSDVLAAVRGEDGLLAALRVRRRTLEDLQTKYEELGVRLAEESFEYRQILEFCRANLLFSQSDDPLSITTIQEAVDEIPVIVRVYSKPELWSSVTRQMNGLTQVIILAVTVAVLLAAGWLFPWYLRRRVAARRDGEPPSEEPTFVGLGTATLRFLVAAAPPVGLFAASVILRRLELTDPLDKVLPLGFYLVGAQLAVLRLSHWFLRDDGVGIHVVGLRPENARALRLAVTFAALSGMFLSVPALLLQKSSLEVRSLPRLLDTAWIVTLAGVLFFLVRRRGPLLRQIARPGRILDRVWVIVGPVLLFVMVAMVVLHVAGYSFASLAIVRNTVWSIVVLAAVMLLYSFLVRLIGRLARGVRKRLVEEFGNEQAQESSDAVSDQLTRLSAILIVGAAVFVLLRAWDEKLVVFDMLAKVELLPLDDGGAVTLLSVLRAFLTVSIGHFVVANLSGVYEFIVFPLIGSTRKGGQFVMLALSRYAILLVAYTLALVFLGVRLSSLGWLLTAASVGIGFGLQEIIANFVAGLILLLERPFQVGDIITVDDTSGTVDSISIRSTIVTNWDRQAVIIPNKDFITKKMTNWTRDDDVTRRKLEIRVAFGSDLERVNRSIHATVTGHAKVLADPPPRIWLSSYEESGFGILVYFFTHVSDGLATRAELYGLVYEALAGEGVEVPVQKHEISVIHEPPASDGFGEEE